VNRVRLAEEIEPWSIGIRALFGNLAARGLLEGATRP
jgi:fumarylacetoacetate (FAA) hydrolase family protein